MSSSTINAGEARVGDVAVFTELGHAWVVRITAQRSNPASIDVSFQILAIIDGGESPRVFVGAEFGVSRTRAAVADLGGWWLRDLRRYYDNHPRVQAALEAYLPKDNPAA